MNLLLDTSAFIRWSLADPRIPASWVDEIVDPSNTVYLSAASAWEIAIKRRSGKLSFEASSVAAAAFHGFAWLGITPQDAEDAGSLEWENEDPFDRMLVAQATSRRYTLVTTDDTMAAAPGIQLL